MIEKSAIENTQLSTKTFFRGIQLIQLPNELWTIQRLVAGRTCSDFNQKYNIIAYAVASMHCFSIL